jgi:hypothetical protein
MRKPSTKAQRYTEILLSRNCRTGDTGCRSKILGDGPAVNELESVVAAESELGTIPFPL